jgi:LysM repeat protein
MTIPSSGHLPPAPPGQTGTVSPGSGPLRHRPGATCDACPWVGTWIDPVPYYAYPSRLNYCYRVEPATSIKLKHQTTYCLSSNYSRCPIYRQKEKMLLPAKKAKTIRLMQWRPLAGVQWPGWESLPRPTRQTTLRFALFLLFVTAALLLAAGWYYNGGVAALPPPETAAATNSAGLLATERPWTPSPSPTATPSATATSTPTATATATKRPPSTTPPTPSPTATTVTATETPLPTATAAGCLPPAGWGEYVVRPGDTLFRLGQRFGATVEALQQGNCLGTVRVIYVGQRLFVPGPEPTATATAEETTGDVE